MFGIDALKSAFLFVWRVIGSSLFGRSNTRMREDASQEQMLLAILQDNPPAKLLFAQVAVNSKGAMIRCRFVRNADLDACAKWFTAKIRAWMTRTGHTCDIEVNQALFEPVISARLLELLHQDEPLQREKETAAANPSPIAA